MDAIVLPFSSEAVLAACVGPLGLDPVISITAATAGNVAGGMTCYWMGHLGNMEWIEKYFHVKKEKMDRAERFVHGRGAWRAFFAFIPILGSAISIVLGMMRANIWIVILAMTIGKILRYALLVWGVLEASALMHKNYETGTNSRWKLYPLCTRTGRTLTFGERGTDGVTTYFYRNGI